MNHDWHETIRALSAQLKKLRADAPKVMKSFSAMAQAALVPKVLPTKINELVALGIAVAIRRDDCVVFHTKAALEQGASPREIPIF